MSAILNFLVLQLEPCMLDSLQSHGTHTNVFVMLGVKTVEIARSIETVTYSGPK